MLAATAVSALTARALASPGLRLAVLDHPNERSLHTVPTPRTGGLAICAGIVTGLLVLALSGLLSDWIWSTCAATLLIAAISFYDDRAGLSPAARLPLQILAAGLLAWGGMRIGELNLPGGPAVSLGRVSAVLTVLFIVWMANLYNFMDGMDGLAGGMAVIGFGFIAALAACGGDRSLAAFAAVVSASAGGFLVFNLPPARIFMGDVGSVPLGFIAGTLAARGAQQHLFDFWVPVLVFSPFIVDATIVVLRRLLHGERVWQAHREHAYQRLVLAGWGHRRTMYAEYVLMMCTGVSAIAYTWTTSGGQLLLLGLWAAVYGGLYQLVAVIERRKHPAGIVRSP